MPLTRDKYLILVCEKLFYVRIVPHLLLRSEYALKEVCTLQMGIAIYDNRSQLISHVYGRLTSSCWPNNIMCNCPIIFSDFDSLQNFDTYRFGVTINDLILTPQMECVNKYKTHIFLHISPHKLTIVTDHKSVTFTEMHSYLLCVQYAQNKYQPISVSEITKSSSTFSATYNSSNIVWSLQLHDTIQMKFNFGTKFSSIYLAKG